MPLLTPSKIRIITEATLGSLLRSPTFTAMAQALTLDIHLLSHLIIVLPLWGRQVIIVALRISGWTGAESQWDSGSDSRPSSPLSVPTQRTFLDASSSGACGQKLPALCHTVLPPLTSSLSQKLSHQPGDCGLMSLIHVGLWEWGCQIHKKV